MNYLFDRRADVPVDGLVAAIALGLLAAFPGVRLATNHIHGDRECRVRLPGDTPIGHRT